MLNKKEVAVMRSVYDACKHNNDACIITDEKIIQSTPEKFKLNMSQVDVILHQLEYDGYFECTKSDRDGKTVNVITLKQKGKAFKREMVQRRRELVNALVMKIVFAAAGAVVALVVNRLLQLL